MIGEVVRSEMITPRMKRVTVGGDDLGCFESKGPDQFMYFLLPPPGMDQLTVGTDFNWVSYRRMDEALRPVGAYYTVRAHRPEVNEIDFDMLLHDDHGGEGGHASRWAASASSGDPVALWGPRTAYEPPDDTHHYYLFADETGLPAIACILETLSADDTASVYLEVDDSDDEIPLTSRCDAEIDWLHRSKAGGDESVLVESALAIAPPDRSGVYVFGGGESRAMTAVRKHVRKEWKLRKGQVSLVAYWRAAK
jgi:NADPH-dependent ferric siderophore reductase